MLEQVLRPLLDDPAAIQVVVVVDGSRDGSIELLDGIAESDPRLEPMFVEHRGKPAACEAALARALGEVVLLLDDDVMALPGLVSGHARHHARAKGLVVMGYMPVALPARRRAGDSPTFLYAAEYEAHCAQLERHPDRVLSGLWGGNISLRRDDYTTVGPSSPRFPDLYHEDQDLGLRCLRAGLTGVFDRSLAARHLHHRTIEAFLRDCRSHGAGRWLVHELHGDLLGRLDPTIFEEGLPRPARWLVRACRHPRVAAAATSLCTGTARAGGALEVFGVEMAAIRLARRFQQQVGASLLAGRRVTAEEMSRGTPGHAPASTTG